jgi:serine carboxypeptidase-like clade 4
MVLKTPQDFEVHGLEDIQPAYADFPGKMYAGTLPTNNGSRRGEMMFWMFEPDTQLVPESMVIWLNGGPGCSSFNCGVMMEHSPVTQPLHAAGYCCLKPTPDLSINEHTWTKATTMLYVEQPIGTGFSYGDPLPETERDAARDIDAFLQNFYGVFEHLKPYDFFIFGESYAGMFVPSFTRFIHLRNQKAIEDRDESRFLVPLKGAALGNGWVDGKIQGPATIDYSWWHGLIDKPTRDALHTQWNNCMYQLGTENDVEPPPFHPFNVQDDCGMMWGILQAAGNPNAYDITTWDPNVDQITFTSEGFYNTPAVIESLHAPTNITWHGCRWGEGRRRLVSAQQLEQHRRLYMDNDRPLSVVPYIAEVLDAGIPVLVYNGDRDMTTNMVGQELTLNAMEWSGKDDWLDAPRGLWKVNDYPAGWTKEHKGLTFIVVYNSGHMVPYNQAAPAYDLVTRFLKGQSYMDTVLPAIRIKALDTTEAKGQTNMFESTILDASVLPTLATSTTPAIENNLFLNASQWELIGVAAVSMIVGFSLAVFFLGKRAGIRKGRYQPVPDADI